MPTVSRFFGISIRMYFDDHPPTHFHAYYGEYVAKLSIETLEVLEGQLPRRALVLVLEWAAEHRDELRENWHLAEQHRPLNPIDPLQWLIHLCTELLVSKSWTDIDSMSNSPMAFAVTSICLTDCSVLCLNP